MGFALIQKTLYAREAEVFAAYTAYTDHEIGRVIQEVQDEGKLDNTLIMYIVGDNGTSAEGTLEGTFNQLTAYNGILTLPEVVKMLHYEDWGSLTILIRICRSRGRGRSTRPSSGPSRWPRISAARGRAWRFPGPVISTMSGREKSARSFITSSMLFRQFSRQQASRRRRQSTASRKNRSKA